MDSYGQKILVAWDRMASVFGGCAMPVHDWSKVDDGTFHTFHHSWVEELHRTLNRGVLPPRYYAMSEQQAAGAGKKEVWSQRSHLFPHRGPVPKASFAKNRVHAARRLCLDPGEGRLLRAMAHGPGLLVPSNSSHLRGRRPHLQAKVLTYPQTYLKIGRWITSRLVECAQ